MEDIPIVSGSNFRIASKRFLLTYESHLDKQAIFNFCNGLQQLKFFIAGHETGDTGYLHTHAYLEFSAKFESRNARVFDFADKHPNVRRIATNLHANRAKDYCAKQDQAPFSFGNPRDTTFSVQGIWDCATESEAIEQFANRPSDVPGILATWRARPVVAQAQTEFAFADQLPELIHEWQARAVDLLRYPADDRAIVWFNDPSGKSGKTWLGRYLYEYGLTLYFTTFNPTTVAHVTAKYIKDHKVLRLIIFNLSRQCEADLSYGSLEMLKDRIFTSSKYDSDIIFIPNNIHVWVMANFEPNRAMLSSDRLRIVNLGTVQL